MGPKDPFALESNGLRPFDEEQAALRAACVLSARSKLGPKDPVRLIVWTSEASVQSALRVNQVLQT